MTPQPPAAELPPQSSQQAPADPLDAAHRISGEEVRKAVTKREAVLVDLRAKESYDLERG